MKILFISKDGASLGLAQRIQHEGHHVFFHISHKEATRVGEEVVEKVGTTSPIINKGGSPVHASINSLLTLTTPDLVIFDALKAGKVADYIRGRGISVLGACRWADEASLDSTYSNRIMRQVDITPIVEGVTEGVRCDVEMWWNGLSSHAHSITFNYNRFMNDNIGPGVESVGCVTRMVGEKTKIVREGVGKLERLLKKTTYRGPITLHSLITNDGLFGLGLRVGFTYDSLSSLFELHKGPLTPFLHGVAVSGNGVGTFTNDHSIAVRLSIPPYPNVGMDARVGVKVWGVGVENERHLWWRDVMKEDDEYVSAGGKGVIVTAVARGRDVMECRRRVYRTINNLTLPQGQWRTDIGLATAEKEKVLRKKKYF